MKLLLRTLLLMTLLPLEFALADDEATSNVITYPSRCGIPEHTKEENLAVVKTPSNFIIVITTVNEEPLLTKSMKGGVTCL